MAVQIASDSLLGSVKMVFSKGVGYADDGILSNYLLGGVKIEGIKITHDTPNGKESDYKKIGEEIFSMYAENANYGSVNQKILSKEEMESKYLNQQEFKYSFNQNNFLNVRDKYLNTKNSTKIKNKT